MERKKVSDMSVGELSLSLEDTLCRAVYFKDEARVVEFVGEAYYARTRRLRELGKGKLADHYDLMWRRLTGYERTDSDCN